MPSIWSKAMAKKSANSVREEVGYTLNQEFQATREIWNEGIQATNACVNELTTQLSQFAKELYASPLGKRAQRHPLVSIGIASLALVVCRRLLRR
jgi:hypothetical protein